MAVADTAELVVALTLRDKLSGGLRNLNSQLKGMQGGLNDVGRGLGQVGSGLDKIATRGVIAAGTGLAAVIKVAADYEQAWVGVEKTTGLAGRASAELRDQFEQLARTTPVTFETLASIGEMGGALGVATDDLDEFADVVARLSVSTDMSVEDLASNLGHMRTILKFTNDEMYQFADAIVALGNAGASTEGEIFTMATRFAAAADQAGFSNEGIAALASTLASMGVEAEAGGGAVSRILNGITLDIATASDEGETLGETLGLSMAELRTAWERDAEGVFGDLLEALGELDNYGRAELLTNLGITNTRDINALSLLADGTAEYTRNLGTAADAAGAVREESDKFFATTAGQWQILQNNIGLAADEIGVKLLPVVNDVMETFVGWLQDPSTQRGITDFANNLASGMRDLVKEVKGADFGPLLDTMKGAAAIAKGAFDAFRSLPEPIQQLALAAIVANKVTGGAVGSIASGLGNILKGTIKLAFDRGSPANPMWVKSIDGGLGGGGPGGTAAGGRGGGVSGALRALLGIGAAVALADALEEPSEELADDIHKAVFRDVPKLGIEDLQWPFGPKNTPTILPELFGGNGLLGGTAPSAGGRSVGGSFGADSRDAAGADTVLLREFGGKLDKLATNEVIEHLARTNEIGLAGIGTSFQVGLTNGLDPIGDTATRILSRADNPKDPPVMAEIQGHLSGLEEIQRTYLDRGDIALAQKVQDNIDTLHTLIGSTDTNRAVTERMAAAATSSDAAMLSTAATQTSELRNTKAAINTLPPKFDGTNARLSGLGYKIDGSNTQLARIAAKDFSPNVYVTSNVSLSASVLQNQVYRQQVTTRGVPTGTTFIP